MLRELHVKNLAVLAAASVELDAGLNVLTGETGAGKSIVVDSLTLLAGARATSELIRTGADTLTVTGIFAPEGEGWKGVLGEAGVDAESEDGDSPGEVIVRREISRTGRNRVYVNDQPTTLRLLSDLAPFLLRIYGQREEMGLLDPDLQRRWLDASGGEEGRAALDAVAAAYDRWSTLDRRLRRLAGDQRAREERLDLLRFQVQELTAANLAPGEAAELRGERDVLRNSEAITQALGGAYELLYEEEGAAVDRLAKSQGLLEDVAEWEPRAAAAVDELEELRVRVEELSVDLRRRLDGMDADPGRLNQVEDRLARLERLFRKYGAETTDELLVHLRLAQGELEEMEGDAEGREELERQVAAALEEYREAALALSAGRRRWGRALVEAIEAELVDLGLGKAKLEFRLERAAQDSSPLVLPDGEGPGGGEGAVEFGPHGLDQVVLYFAPNPGEEPRPLSVIASGGELSRIYLALQLAVLSRGGGVDGGGAEGDRSSAPDGRPTLVFDEVDVGIGGAQAAALGRKLQRLAGGSQILVVTHLPQVASFGDHHFRVHKEVKGERTFTRVDALDGDSRTEEVARMLAGDKTTNLSLSHARELIETAAVGREAG